jgi:hypothetical protein
MSLGCGGIDHLHVDGTGFNQRVEQLLPEAASCPAMKAIINGCRWAVGGRTILPPATDTQDIDNTAENPSVIDPACAGAVLWQQGLDHGPLAIIQPKEITHDFPPSMRRESQRKHAINQLIGF